MKATIRDERVRRIAVVSPGYPALKMAPARSERARAYLEGNGYQVSFGRSAHQCTGHTAGSGKDRADDIHEAFMDPDIDLILTALGGTKGYEVLDFLDYPLIAKHSKPFCGHSSNLALLYALAEQSAVPALHGPSFVNQLGEFPEPHPGILDCFEAATRYVGSGTPYLLPHFDQMTLEMPGWWTDPNETKARSFSSAGHILWNCDRPVRGEFFGGHLMDLFALVATNTLDFPSNPFIFVWDTLEVTTETVLYHLDRLASLAGFGNCVGVVVGTPSSKLSEQGSGFIKTVHEWCVRKGLPSILNVPFGHRDPSWTIPLGCYMEIDPVMRTLRVVSP